MVHHCFAYLIILHDFVSFYSHGINLDLCTLYLFLFADDLVMFADIKAELQRLIIDFKCIVTDLKVGRKTPRN